MIKQLQGKQTPKCDIRLSYSRLSKFASLGAKELNDETRTIIDNDGVSFGKLVDLQDYSELKVGGEIRNLLILNRDNWAGSGGRLKKVSSLIDKILKIINKELKN